MDEGWIQARWALPGPGLSARLAWRWGSRPPRSRCAPPMVRYGGGAAAGVSGGLDREKNFDRPRACAGCRCRLSMARLASTGSGSRWGGRGARRRDQDEGVNADGRESRGDRRPRAGKNPGPGWRKAYPDAPSTTPLDFTTPLELLVATILSAQCTTERVNAGHRRAFPRTAGRADWGERAVCPCSSTRSTHRLLPRQGQVAQRDGPRPGRAARRERVPHPGGPGRLPGSAGRPPKRGGWGSLRHPGAAGGHPRVPGLAAPGPARGDDPEKIHDQLCQVAARGRAGHRPATC